jgi:hypothetical protein
MNSLLNPRSVFVANTLPQTILLLAYYSQYTVIRTQLDADSLWLWTCFGFTMLLLVLLNFAFALALTIKRKPLPVIYGVLALVTYTAYVIAWYFHSDKLIPWSIPRWAISEDAWFYTLTFIMPALAHAVFMIVAGVTNMERNPSIWKNLVGAILIPGILYLSFLAAAKLIRVNFFIPGLIWVVGLTILFLFLLVRTTYILMMKKEEALKKYSLLWKIPITLVLPLLGLAVNNGLLFGRHLFGEEKIFGNFSHPAFYVLAVVNAVLLCMPALPNKTYRLLLFIARCITLAYTAYFFLVFLPFMPLSVIAVIAIGVGFLMLAPVILMVVHVAELSGDYRFLKAHYSPMLITGVAAIGFLVLPAAITGNYWHTRTVLHKSLDYLYSTDYNKSYHADKNALSAALKVIEEEGIGSRMDFMSRKLPYLSSYFKWLVLDNMTLPESKINLIKAVYFGENNVQTNWGDVTGSADVGITDVKTTSTWDAKQNAWLSEVNLSITDSSVGGWQEEYATELKLPPGCWISDYYLYIDSVKEHGLLVEKGAAMWIYQQIVHVSRRDPGLLFYLTGNRVAFRAFPFAPGQTRQTGIQFLHKEPVTLEIGGRHIALGDATKQPMPPIEKYGDATVYIPAAQKKNLEKVKRTPYYHFVVDVSIGQQRRREEYSKRIEKELNSNRLGKANAKVSFVNSNSNTYAVSDGLRAQYDQQQFEGGFYLERAIKAILTNAVLQPANTYPVIVVVADTMEGAIIENDFADLQFTYPEGHLFYRLNTEGKLEAHTLWYNPIHAYETVDSIKAEPYVLAYPDKTKPVAFLCDNDLPDVIVTGDVKEPDVSKMEAKNWNAALGVQGDWQMQVLHPAVNEERWKNAVAASFATQVMSPVTSYIVVENEMQKEVLKRKQEEILKAKKALGEQEKPQNQNNNDNSTGAPIDGGILALVMGLVAYSYRLLRPKREK